MLKIPSYDAMRQAVVVGLCLACQAAPVSIRGRGAVGTKSVSVAGDGSFVLRRVFEFRCSRS